MDLTSPSKLYTGLPWLHLCTWHITCAKIHKVHVTLDVDNNGYVKVTMSDRWAPSSWWFPVTQKTISEINSQIRKAFAWSEGKKRGDYTKHSYEEKAIIAWKTMAFSLHPRKFIPAKVSLGDFPQNAKIKHHKNVYVYGRQELYFSRTII